MSVQNSGNTGYIESLRIPNHIQNTDPTSQRKMLDMNQQSSTKNGSSNVSRSRASKAGQQIKRNGSSNRAINGGGSGNAQASQG